MFCSIAEHRRFVPQSGQGPVVYTRNLPKFGSDNHDTATVASCLQPGLLRSDFALILLLTAPPHSALDRGDRGWNLTD